MEGEASATASRHADAYHSLKKHQGREVDASRRDALTTAPPPHCRDQVTMATATHVTSTRPYSRCTATVAVSSGELNRDSHPNPPKPIADDGCSWCLHVRSRLQAACLHAVCLRALIVCRWQAHHSTTTHVLVPPHVFAPPRHRITPSPSHRRALAPSRGCNPKLRNPCLARGASHALRAEYSITYSG